MATVNQYKFLGSTIATDVEQTLLTPAIEILGPNGKWLSFY